MTNSNKRVPDTSYNTKYPYNQVFLTEGGHLVEFDNTPGAERVRIGHKSGGYTEMNSDGSVVTVHAGHHYEYAKGGKTVTSDHNIDTKAGGGTRATHAGDSYIETNGDQNTVHNGDKIEATIGSITQMVKGNFNQLVQGHVTSKTNGDLNQQVEGAATIKATGGFQITSDSSSITLSSQGASMTMSDGVFTFNATKFVFNGEVHLGADGGTLAVMSTDQDSAGNKVPSPQSKKVFIS
ncbi:MAG: hypothetical protein P4L79_09865 [Legionella sp.]|uniref:hypothetical protein n=1 Tax=Legionella sp. TaxID=459 RepID=UPI00284696EE|nr:hypothetical protein [Legionella sp.]